MRNYYLYISLLISVVVLSSCIVDEPEKLAPAEERVEQAISELKTELLSSSRGWKLEYQPTNESGVFFMILDFSDDYLVNIKSDAAENDGEFFDHTITWRIDNALGLELILETYGVFHYLFEQDGATFGAEFEFMYIGKEGENLVFRSISDISGNEPRIIFEPASTSDQSLLAREVSTNLAEFATISPRALESPVPRQQIYLENADISIFWALDPAKRIVRSSLAGIGKEIDADFNGVVLDHYSGYKLQGNSLELLDPLEFVLNNTLFSINSISFSDFSNDGPGFCSLSADPGPEYDGQIPGLGSISMTASLFDLEGTAFQPIPEYPYSVNSFFIFDESGNSLSDDGMLIVEKFPNAVAFLFYYGFESTTMPANAAGFLLEDQNGETEIFLREFQPTTTVGNKIEITLTDNFYHSNTPSGNDQANLVELTDLLFAGGEMYAFDYPVEGLAVFKLFNPCNQYEVFLVQ